ncbi:hypothetical protein AB833_19285 [Chromatiales bacterium (ex Bugula neritina AB1)]|nr:hypothetical protein AB833_19285 [Chromatiales bacterium (ex Bugula neritina AB1)]
MLRESIENHEQEVDLNVLIKGGDAAEIEFHKELIAFSEAIVSADSEAIGIARDKLIEVAGTDVMIEAAGVVSNFQRMVRIADSTGIELGDDSIIAQTEELRDSLGINQFKG